MVILKNLYINFSFVHRHQFYSQSLAQYGENAITTTRHKRMPSFPYKGNLRKLSQLN
jgi:hypothetical protein